MRADITVSSPITRTPRVLQTAGMFDVPLEDKTTLTWHHKLPVEDKPWSIGLIIGPSGAGKTTLAREFWPDALAQDYPWSPGKALIDDFPEGMSIRDVTGLLSAVGLSSPPAWLRPFGTLSNGEAFRASIARALAETDGLVVVDEFSSVVDRQVAKVASHAAAKTIRRGGRQLVAVTCHYDVEDWLQPDWTYDVAASEFAWRSVQRHPPVQLAIHKTDRTLWPVFERHHYLTAQLHPAARCFAAFCDGQPVAFASYLHFPHPRIRNLKMAHRIVVLPDWQGLGIAGHVSEWLGQHLSERGYRFRITTAHPAFIHYMARSPRWRASVKAKRLNTRSKDASLRARSINVRGLATRSFEYVSPRTLQPSSREPGTSGAGPASEAAA